MRTAAEFYRIARVENTHEIAVLIAKECNSSGFRRFVFRGFIHLHATVFQHLQVGESFNFSQLFWRDGCIMTEVETESLWLYQ